MNNVVDDFRAEALVRAMSVVSKNCIGVVDHPTTGKVLKKSVIPGAITYALEVGKALRQANEKGEDPADSIVEKKDGKILFRGIVTDLTWDTVDGFTVGDVSLEGIGDCKGETYKVWFKNEHIVSYRNGIIDVTVPDLICVLSKEGVPINNPFYTIGMELVVFALPAPEQWVSEKGLQVFGPRSFGFDLEYKPFQK